MKSDLTNITQAFDAIITVDGLPVLSRLIAQAGPEFETLINQKIQAGKKADKPYVSVTAENLGCKILYILLVDESSADILGKFSFALTRCLGISVCMQYHTIGVSNITQGQKSIPFLKETIQNWDRLHNRKAIVKNAAIVTDVSNVTSAPVCLVANFLRKSQCILLVSTI